MTPITVHVFHDCDRCGRPRADLAYGFLCAACGESLRNLRKKRGDYPEPVRERIPEKPNDSVR